MHHVKPSAKEEGLAVGELKFGVNVLVDAHAVDTDFRVGLKYSYDAKANKLQHNRKRRNWRHRLWFVPLYHPLPTTLKAGLRGPLFI
jgi:hypothetical protein